MFLKEQNFIILYIFETGYSYLSHCIIKSFPWKKYEIKTSFVSPKVPKAQANIICKLHMIYQYRIGSNPSDINRFRRHTGKLILHPSPNSLKNMICYFYDKSYIFDEDNGIRHSF